MNIHTIASVLTVYEMLLRTLAFCYRGFDGAIHILEIYN